MNVLNVKVVSFFCEEGMKNALLKRKIKHILILMDIIILVMMHILFAINVNAKVLVIVAF
jgi:hypothetical protein